ncbi:hypothetical protein ACS0TY_001510 [Phlomoides rotata]
MLGMPEFHLLIGVAVSSLSSSSRSTNLSGFTSHPVGNFVAEVNKEALWLYFNRLPKTIICRACLRSPNMVYTTHSKH